MEENYQNQGGGQPQGNQFILGLLGGIATISVIAVLVMAVMLVNKDKEPIVSGDTDINTNITQDQNQNQPPAENQLVPAQVEGVNTFQEMAGADICTEDGKPVVFLFSTTWCPHCTWIKDTFDSTVKKYVDEGKIKAYHWELDTNDDTLTAAVESAVPPGHAAVYQEFNPSGSIPTFVFGCKYVRVGNGYEGQDDLDAEKAEFEALIGSMIE